MPVPVPCPDNDPGRQNARGLARRTFLAGAATTLWAGVATAQSPAAPARAVKTARVATLWTTSQSAAQPYVEAVEEGLRELGWIAGQNLVLEHRFTDGDPDRLADVAAEVLRWKPDVAVAPLNTGALALKKLTSTTPIVFVVSFDPVGSGLASSLGRPGGNATGMMGISPDITAKRLQLLREAAPTVRRVGVIWNATFPGLRPFRNSVDDAGRKLGITVVDAGLKEPDDLPRVFEQLARERVDGLYVIGDNMTFLRRREIAEAALRRRWPSAFAARESCDEGGLICYGVNQRAQFKRSALFLDKILRGTSPAAIPIEQPNTYTLVLNLRTAKALDIAIPRSMLLRADGIIE
jgi:putative ABC transport system substrate-binding protein